MDETARHVIWTFMTLYVASQALQEVQLPTLGRKQRRLVELLITGLFLVCVVLISAENLRDSTTQQSRW